MINVVENELPNIIIKKKKKKKKKKRKKKRINWRFKNSQLKFWFTKVYSQ